MNSEQLEAEYLQQGTLSDQTSPAALNFLYRVKEFKFRKSELIYRTQSPGGLDPLQKLRTLISRGKVEEATFATHLSVAQPAELLLEKSRIFCLRGDWATAVKTASQALVQMELPTQTQLTLCQVRSVAYYELGQWTESIADIDLALTLAECFPKIRVSFYAQVLEMKSRMMLTGRVDSARAMLERLWREALAGPLDLDILLTLFRAESEILRQEGKAYEAYAVAAGTIARAMGDRFYEGLAYLELAYSPITEVAELFGCEIKDFAKEYERIHQGLSAVEPTSTSIKLLKSQPKRGSTNKRFQMLLGHRGLTTIICASRGFVVDATLSAAEALPLTEQQRNAVVALAEGEISRVRFFEKMWPGVRYSKERSDSALRAVLKRLKVALGQCLVTGEGKVALRATLVLD